MIEIQRLVECHHWDQRALVLRAIIIGSDPDQLFYLIFNEIAFK